MHSKFPLILPYSGWQTANIGDVGHTPGTLRYRGVDAELLVRGLTPA